MMIEQPNSWKKHKYLNGKCKREKQMENMKGLLQALAVGLSRKLFTNLKEMIMDFVLPFKYLTIALAR